MTNKTDFSTMIDILPFTIRFKLKRCIQDPIYHPEGSVYNHIEIVFNNILKMHGPDVDLLVAAIFHDLGKLDCIQKFEKDGVHIITNIGHAHESLKYIDKYFKRYKEYTTNKEKVTMITEKHMNAHGYINGEMKKHSKRLKFEELEYFDDIIKFSMCDTKKL